MPALPTKHYAAELQRQLRSLLGHEQIVTQGYGRHRLIKRLDDEEPIALRPSADSPAAFKVERPPRPPALVATRRPKLPLAYHPWRVRRGHFEIRLIRA